MTLPIEKIFFRNKFLTNLFFFLQLCDALQLIDRRLKRMTPDDAEEFLQAAARMRAQEKAEEDDGDDLEDSDESDDEESEYESGSEESGNEDTNS